MRARLAICLVGACCLVLGAPAAALGQAETAPPDNSAIDQYLETVPGPAGDRPARERSGEPGGGGGGGAAPLDAQTRRELRALGPDGRAVAELAAEGGAVSGGSTGSGSETGGAGGQGDGGGDGQGGVGDTESGADADGGERGGADSGATPADARASEGDGPASGTLESAAGGAPGGLGLALPIILGLTLLVALGLAVRQRRAG